MTRQEKNGRAKRDGDDARRGPSAAPRSASKRKAPAKAPDPAMASAAGEPATPARQRIAKLMARTGLCSRRDAEAWIVDGRVSVNGVTLTSPAFDVGPDDAVLVDNAPLPTADKTRLFLFHKPRGYITSDHDPEGRPTIFDHLHEHWPDGPRVVTIGRLDINTEGLLLLTNDGGLARLLELPKTGWVRRYRVRAKGETNQAVLDGLAHGVTIDGIDYAGVEAKLDRIQGANCWLTMGLREGKNREVKRVLEHIGLDVNRLIRLSFGPFQLLDLPEGHVEEVRTRILSDQLGPVLAAEAGVDLREPEPTERPIPAALIKARTSNRSPAARMTPPPQRAGRPAAATSRRRDDRDDRDTDASPEKRERPTAGPRKHVSAIRAQRGAADLGGPRKRLERSDTVDAKRRVVTVERLVSKAPADEPTRSPRRGRDRSASGSSGERSAARPPFAKPSFAKPSFAKPSFAKPSFVKAGRVSPSAEAKRVRIARSGAKHQEADDARPIRARRDESEAPRGRTRRDSDAPSSFKAPGRAGAGQSRRDATPERSREDRKPPARQARPPRDGAPAKRGRPGAEQSGAGQYKAGKSQAGRSGDGRSGGRPSTGKSQGRGPRDGTTKGGQPGRGPSRPPRRPRG